MKGNGTRESVTPGSRRKGVTFRIPTVAKSGGKERSRLADYVLTGCVNGRGIILVGLRHRTGLRVLRSH